jgi:hypothetical protein
MRRRIYVPLMLVAAPGLLTFGLVTSASAASSNGVASKSANQIVAAATSAINGAKSFTYGGTTRSSGVPTGLKISLSSAGDGQGTLTSSGQPVKLIKIGDTLYVSSTVAFWTKNLGASAGQTLGTKWVSASSTDSDYAGIANLFEASEITGQFLSTSGTTWTKGKTSTVNGQPVVAVVGKSGSTVNTVYVATTGKAYVIRISAPGGNGGTLNFTNYNKPVNPTAPPNPISVPSSTSTTG